LQLTLKGQASWPRREPFLLNFKHCAKYFQILTVKRPGAGNF
jgi:hypothetical protein